MLKLLATALCTIAACLLVFLGWHYDNVGFGLNPLAAYPLASLLLAAPFAAYWGEA